MSDIPYVADANELEADRDLELEELLEDEEECPWCGDILLPEEVLGGDDGPERCPNCGEEI